MAQHHYPVQPGLVLDGFARDKMLFRVAQKSPLKKASRKFAAGEPATDDRRRWWLANCHPSSRDRKSTRLNSSHLVISYAVFCLKKKKTHTPTAQVPTSTTSIPSMWGSSSHSPLPTSSPFTATT